MSSYKAESIFHQQKYLEKKHHWAHDDLTLQ